MPSRNRRPCGTATEARQVGPPTSAMREVAKKSPAARGRRAVREETPNAGTGRRRSPPSTSTVAGRSGHVAEFQISRKSIFQHRSDRERPHNESGTHHRSKASAASRIEPHSIPGDVGNLPDRSRPRESAIRHGCRLEKSPSPPSLVHRPSPGESFRRDCGTATTSTPQAEVLTLAPQRPGPPRSGSRRLTRDASPPSDAMDAARVAHPWPT